MSFVNKMSRLSIGFVLIMSMLFVSVVHDSNTKVSAQAACPNIGTSYFPPAPYSNAEIECLLRSGEQTAINWDECREQFRANAAIFGGNIRNMINGYSATRDAPSGCGYRSDTWLSERNRPNASMPIDMPYTTTATNVPLQINYTKFMAGPLVQTDYNGSGGWSRIYNDNTRWANGTNGGNDRRPNAIGTTGQKPAHVASRTKVVSLRPYRIVGGVETSANLSVSNVNGQFMTADRNANPNSRYWFSRSPINVNLNVNDGIRGSTTIYVEMRYRRADGVWKGDPRVGDYVTLCTKGTDRHEIYSDSINYRNIDQCEISEMTLQINIELTQDFKLIPFVSAPQGSIQAGDSITASGTINNTGATSSFPDTTRRITRLVYAPGVLPAQGAGTSNTTPCTYFTGETSCDENYVSATGAIRRGNGFPLGTRSEVIGALPVGSRVCYAASVSRQDETGNPSWAHSVTRCSVVAANPRLSIVGGDAASGGDFACGTTTGGFRGSPSLPGSFTEYGLLTAPGDIDTFSSAGMADAETALTFANNPSTDPPGNYNSSRCVTNLEPDLRRGVTLAAYGGGALPAAGNWRTSGDVTISASSMANGRRLIIADPGRTVTISGNLTYSAGPFARFADAPSLIIVADTIRVAAGVTQIDGLFIARNSMSTCSEAGATTTAVKTPAGLAQIAATGACRTNRLTINGAVISNGELVPARSAGGESAAAAPAEIIKFRPEVFLTPIERSTGSAALKTDREVELPPRN